MTLPDADPSAGSDPIELTRSGAVATLTFNRPAVLNVLDVAMMDALVRHTGAVAADPSLHVLVLRGAGPHFMAGGDLRCFADLLADRPADLADVFERIVLRVQTAIENIHRMPQIAVAAVHGAVAGFGLSIAAACDLVVTPDGGATWSLPRMVGLRRALAICLLGERFGAEEAERIGLVNRVVAAADLDAAIATIVGRLESGPHAALRNVKRLLRDSLERPLAVQLEAEARSFAQCAATPDFAEGIDAFLAKRPPRFAR
jgi:2-(1,2-epoxy-1,2-dihydrophenyl)acetyl-CoA isomerase